MANILGFEIVREEPENLSFVQPDKDDGAVSVASGGVYGTFVDLDGSIKTEAELVSKYRDMSMYPEVDQAIDDIINEVITDEPDEPIVEILLDDVEQSDRIKKLLTDEFEEVLRLLEFNDYAYDIFRKWYIDGRLYYHAIIDEDNVTDGIKELRYIDPRKIRKVREVSRGRMPGTTTPLVQTKNEYYIFSERGFAKTSGNAAVPNNNVGGIQIAKDSIVHCTSGRQSDSGDLILSYLHKAIKPLNQLRSMEDSLVIYRISRAPERRIFYVDVGNLPTMKAEQYVRDMMTKFKNKLVYDSSSGEIRDDRKFMTMLEDFWLPRRDGGRGTEITTLPGGQNLDQLEDVVYFQRKLYKSLNVPISRLDPEVQYTFGRATEITRDEVKFAKFIARLRKKFSQLFLKILERQVILKNIMTPEEWDEIKNLVRFQYCQDNYYAELKRSEIMRDRMSLVRDMDDYVGRYFSHGWVRRHVIYQTEEDMDEIDKEIAAEASNPQYAPPPAEGGDPTAGGGVDQQPAPQDRAGPQPVNDSFDKYNR